MGAPGVEGADGPDGAADAASGSPGTVEAVSASSTHGVGKANRLQIQLVTGIGVEGDAHAGVTVKHRSRVRRDPHQPNLRQVHLIHGELHDELRAAGFTVGPGEMGENITTRRLDLLALPTGTRLHIGPEAVVEVTGLRNPCAQLDGIQPGLRQAVLGRDAAGNRVGRTGVMGVVHRGGPIAPGDAIRVELPPPPHTPLDRV